MRQSLRRAIKPQQEQLVLEVVAQMTRHRHVGELVKPVRATGAAPQP